VFENCLYSLQKGSGTEIKKNDLNSNLIVRTVCPEKLQLKEQQLLTAYVKGPLQYLFRPLLRKNEFAVTQHMYAFIGPNLDNIH